jgi:nitroreductase
MIRARSRVVDAAGILATRWGVWIIQDKTTGAARGFAATRRTPTVGGDEMELFEAIEKRASVRELKPADISDADLNRILDAGRRAPSGMNRQPFEFIVIRDPVSLRTFAECQACVADVNTAIAVVAAPEASRFWLEDLSAATENMLLAITALGYATVWIEGRILPREDELKQMLGVPQKLRLIVILPVGKAAGAVAQKEKRPLDQVVHRERYGVR